jgi:hypothetical protein
LIGIALDVFTRYSMNTMWGDASIQRVHVQYENNSLTNVRPDQGNNDKYSYAPVDLVSFVPGEDTSSTASAVDVSKPPRLSHPIDGISDGRDQLDPSCMHAPFSF